MNTVTTCPDPEHLDCPYPSHPSCPKLPHVDDIKMLKCISVTISDGRTIVLKQDDVVGIQFICGNNILVRRGRIKDFKIVNNRDLLCKTDNLSHIVLDCSEQFSVKIIEIKFKDIVDIRDDENFTSYEDRITELSPGCIHGNVHIPVRERGMAVMK